MQPSIRVASVQMSSQPLKSDVNRDRLVELASTSAASEAQLVVFPELCNTGYVTGVSLKDKEAFFAAAEEIPGPTTEALSELARRFNMYIVIGLAERDSDRFGVLYNTVVLLDDNGKICGRYRKVHLAAEEKLYFYPGHVPKLISTRLGKIGLMICYDGMFPELARSLALQGADIVCISFNWVRVGTFAPEQLKQLVTTRALENRTYFIAACKVGGYADNVYLGASLVAGPSGEVLCECQGQDEEIILATLQADVLLRERIRWTPLRDRRPEIYAEQLGDYDIG